MLSHLAVKTYEWSASRTSRFKPGESAPVPREKNPFIVPDGNRISGVHAVA